MPRHIEVQNTPPVMSNDEEAIENAKGDLCLAKTPSGQKLNRRIDILTVKSYLDRPTPARWKAMKIQADGILARDRYL